MLFTCITLNFRKHMPRRRRRRRLPYWPTNFVHPPLDEVFIEQKKYFVQPCSRLCSTSSRGSLPVRWGCGGLQFGALSSFLRSWQFEGS